MSRHEERIIAFQALFSWEALSCPAEWHADYSWVKEGTDLTYPRLLVNAVIASHDEVDATIKRHLVNWDFSRIGKVELAVLRLGAWCLINEGTTDGAVIIDECVKIAREFAAGESFRFVNGILDAIHKERKKV